MKKIGIGILMIVIMVVLTACTGDETSDKEFTIVFYTNGGTDVASVKVKEGNSFAQPTSPLKDGYTFDGWFSDIELTNEYDFSNENRW